MCGLRLVLPCHEYLPGYIEARRESPPAESAEEPDYDAAWQREFLYDAQCSRLGLGLAPNRVPETAYWLVDGAGYIGEGRIRHWLAPHLLLYGGHLGYAIRPSRRRRGYGSALLGLLLPRARRMGLVTVLIMCEADNQASRRIIEKHAGRLHDLAHIEIDDEPYYMRRCLIDTGTGL